MRRDEGWWKKHVMAFSRVRASWAQISSFARRVRANAGTARSLDDELAAAHGVTIEQYEILRRLALRGNVRQAELSEPPLVTAANVRRSRGTKPAARRAARLGTARHWHAG
jgi:hypothetical protein